MTPVNFSYLPVANLNDQTYKATPPNGPADYSTSYSGWVAAVKAQAYNAYRAAFANLPAIVNLHVQPVPLYGGTKGVIGFEYTIYITGQWHTGGGFFNLD